MMKQIGVACFCYVGAALVAIGLYELVGYLLVGSRTTDRKR